MLLKHSGTEYTIPFQKRRTRIPFLWCQFYELLAFPVMVTRHLTLFQRVKPMAAWSFIPGWNTMATAV